MWPNNSCKRNLLNNKQNQFNWKYKERQTTCMYTVNRRRLLFESQYEMHLKKEEQNGMSQERISRRSNHFLFQKK